MRWRLACLMLALAACAEPKDVQLAGKWRCGPVKGLEAITGDKSPAWIIVGELTETAEAPAAIADIACHLATDERKLFVGVTDYAGGATDAETKMLATLKAMIAKGAPIVVGHLDTGARLSSTRNKDESEKARARALTQQVAAAGASHALLFVAHAEAINEPIAPIGERFAGYIPMPMYLEGGVVTLEIAPYPSGLATGPEIRIYPAARSGFSGLLTLGSLTRPSIEVALPRQDWRRDLEDAAPPKDEPPPPPREFSFGNISPITPEEYQALYDQVLHAIPARAPD